MKHRLRLMATLFVLLAGAFFGQSAFAAGTACNIPTAPASSQDETAWQIFTAINCSDNGTFVWETWTEQTCIRDGGCDTTEALDSNGRRKPHHHLHGSHLAARLPALLAAKTPGGCSPMTVKSKNNKDLDPFVPTNLGTNPEFCEEVFVNPAELSYINAPAQGASMRTLTAQQSFTSGGAPIQFPAGAIEVKADWLPAASLKTPFECDGPKKLKGVYTETIDSKCYALVGVHISSKLYPNWLWATFEPQNTTTNPNRCNPKLYSHCSDSWGSNPAISTGAKTAATKNLSNLMDQAGLPVELHNYRLVGTQTDFTKPTFLGNSFVEFNAQVPPKQASCITCHSYAMFTSAPPAAPSENPNFGAFPGTPPVGNPGKPPAGTWIAQDFSWLLGILKVN